jgi:hypothetical protein
MTTNPNEIEAAIERVRKMADEVPVTEIYPGASAPEIFARRAADLRTLISAASARDLDGHFFEPEHLNEDQRVLALALKLALDRGGQTTPVGHYDIDRAREIVTGEVNEIARLSGLLNAAEARVKALQDAITPFALHLRDELPDDAIIETVAWTAGDHRRALDALIGETK